VIHIARVNTPSRDRPLLVEAVGVGSLVGACARARGVKRSDPAVGSAHETVRHVARVDVVSRDHPDIVDIVALGALVGALARARSFKLGEFAVGSAHSSHEVNAKMFERLTSFLSGDEIKE
jgi:hypothetical protein